MVPRSTAGSRKARPRPSDGVSARQLSRKVERAALLSDKFWRLRFPAGGRAEAGASLRVQWGCVLYPGASIATRLVRLSMPGVKLTTQAYCKMVLHGAKYPHCAVNGLLVAERQRPRKEHPQGAGSHTLFVDCIPLFHGTLALAPMLEVALTLIDSWCKENSYVIAGYYQANERVKDASPNQVAEKVASRIAEGFSDTALIMVDNAKFTMDCAAPTIHVYEHHENRWRCRDPHHDYCEDWPEAQRISASLLDSRSYETLVDFDNHLDDIRNDWTNPEINKAVLHLC